jgi:hypothetical protein
MAEWKKIGGLVAIICAVAVSTPIWAGNKKIMSIRAARVLAERALVESIYGLQIEASEEVTDMVAASFKGRTATTTKATIQGITFEDMAYDPDKDVAKVTASVQLDSINNIDGKPMNLGNKVYRRVAFATSTPSMAGPLKALRAAELDAYKQLAKHVVGFTLESKTTVENYILTSDVVKTKVVASLYLSDLVDFGWDEYGDAFVKLSLNVNDFSAIIGQKVVGTGGEIVVEGQGSQEDDHAKAK